MLSAKRREQTIRIIKHRLKQIKDMHRSQGFWVATSINKDLVQPHRLAKKAAFGCSRSGCLCCHHAKFDDKIPETMI